MNEGTTVTAMTTTEVESPDGLNVGLDDGTTATAATITTEVRSRDGLNNVGLDERKHYCYCEND